jgi:UDP-N-acetylmuramoyl-L-alanyl-D-glutamate--2,6-diaminopimelate ligase
VEPALTLAELVAGLGGRLRGDGDSVVVRGIAVDSRQVRPGDLFVALPGARTHGQLYLADARARGAVAAVVPEEAPACPDLPCLVHPRPEAVLPLLAARLYGHPARRLRVFGVTGTNGKTTTALLVAALIRGAGRPTAHWTTTEVSIGAERFRPLWTTPPAHRLQRFLAAALAAGQHDVVLEVSSHAVALGRIAGVPFAAAAVTNISPDHLDFHGDFPSYVAAKRALVAGLGPEAVAVLNADDPLVAAFASATPAHVATFGWGPEAGVRAEALQADADGCRFLVRVRDGRLGDLAFPVAVPLIGRHNVQNCLAAIAVALAAGVSPEAIAAALAAFTPPPRRLESRRVGPFTVVNDVAMNEASYATVLATVAELGCPQVVVVHAIRGQRGPEVNARIGATLAAWNRTLGFAPLIVSLSRDRLGRYPVDYQVTEAELAAFRAAAEAGGLALSLHAELAAAVAEAVARLQPGGLLLLLGTFGMDDGPGLAVALLEERLHLPPSPPVVYPEQRDG